MREEFIAHVHKNDDGIWTEPHELSEHLENTARMAEAYAAKFNSSEWGKAVGDLFTRNTYGWPDTGRLLFR